MAPRLTHLRYPVGPAERVPYSGNQGRSDGRGFARAYDPRFEGDVAAAQNVRNRVDEQGVTPFDVVIDNLNAKNLPPQLVQSSYLVKIPAVGVAGAQLLIPKNPRRRFSFLVSNFTGANNVLFSYDKPFTIDGGIGAGIPIGSCFEETNGSVSVNGIWVFCNDSGETYPIPILGYEGGISNIGNLP